MLCAKAFLLFSIWRVDSIWNRQNTGEVNSFTNWHCQLIRYPYLFFSFLCLTNWKPAISKTHYTSLWLYKKNQLLQTFFFLRPRGRMLLSSPFSLVKYVQTFEKETRQCKTHQQQKRQRPVKKRTKKKIVAIKNPNIVVCRQVKRGRMKDMRCKKHRTTLTNTDVYVNTIFRTIIIIKWKKKKNEQRTNALSCLCIVLQREYEKKPSQNTFECLNVLNIASATKHSEKLTELK